MSFTQELATYHAVTACRQAIAAGFDPPQSAADAAAEFGADPAQVQRLATEAEAACSAHHSSRHQTGRPKKQPRAIAGPIDQEHCGMSFAEFEALLGGPPFATTDQLFDPLPPIEKLGVPPATSQRERKEPRGGGGVNL